MATRGVIDIGTNSVKLLVGEVAGGRVDPLFEGSEQTRLGAGFYETRRLLPEPIQKTAEAVAAFIENAQRFEPASLHIIATSAARDAVNANELLKAVRAETGREVMVISGEQEADWAFAGVASDPAFGNGALLVMDIGGGSTEIVFGENRERRAGRSFQIGSVRLLEQIRPSDPPTEAERENCRSSLRSFFGEQIEPFIKQHLGASRPLLILTGGTGSILGRLRWSLTQYDRAKIESTILSAREVADEARRLWSMRLAERKRLPGMPGSRADVIIMGAAILEAAMETLGFCEARISTRGIRFGALLHAEEFGSM